MPDRSPRGHFRPHHTAWVADEPCRKCEYDWARHVVCVDLDADEWVTYPACARCKTVADRYLIAAAIKVSRMSARRFAVEVLARNERTVRRWIAGESPLPRAVREMCERRLAPTLSDPST